MTLKLNEKVVPYVEFYGKTIDQMPELIKQGRIPMSVKGLMERRLQVADYKNEDLKQAYWLNYFYTGDAVVRHPDGRVKIVLDSDHLRRLNPESKLLNDGLILTNDDYKRLNGDEFKADEFEKHNGKSLTQKQVNENPIWKVLARDPNLLKEYAAKTFAMAKAEGQFNYNKNMSLYLPSAQEKPIMRLWCVWWLSGRSNAYGSSLDVSDGRLVGVAPEALVAKNLEAKVRIE